MSREIYAQVTASIVSHLEQGVIPWEKPWSAYGAGNSIPLNAATKRSYSGINVPLLWMTQAACAYAAPRFLTFKQALELKGNVKKGERGSRVFFVSTLDRTETDDLGREKDVKIPFLKAYTVFNVEQCENLPDSVFGDAVAINQDQRNQHAEEFLQATGAEFVAGSEAYYVPSRDVISMPAFEAFKTSDDFYCTSFHELGHWTGHKARLDRDLKNRFGSRQYAAEELIAELTSAFLCAEFGFDMQHKNASYISTWIDLLKNDDRAIFTAASQAQQAANHLRGLALAEPEAIAA